MLYSSAPASGIVTEQAPLFQPYLYTLKRFNTYNGSPCGPVQTVQYVCVYCPYMIALPTVDGLEDMGGRARGRGGADTWLCDYTPEYRYRMYSEYMASRAEVQGRAANSNLRPHRLSKIEYPRKYPPR